MGPLINSNGELTNDNFEICQLLQQQYLSVFSEPSDSNYISDIQNFFFIDNTIAGKHLNPYISRQMTLFMPFLKLTQTLLRDQMEFQPYC